jgi:hypothetical protein
VEFRSSRNAIRPLSTSYIGDVELNFIKVLSKSEEGLSLFDEEYLKGCLDNKINNYSSLYLSKEKAFGEFMQLSVLNKINPQVLSTTISILSADSFFTVKAEENKTLSIYSTSIFNTMVSEYDKIFDINFLDKQYCNISHRISKVDYYLNYSNGFKFSISPTEESKKFGYIFDPEFKKIIFYKNINGINNVLTFSDGILSCTSILSSYKDNAFDVNYIYQDMAPKLDTSWVSYDPKNKNSYTILNERSIYGLKNNYLIYTQYSNVTSNNLEANILMLKNQYSNTNYSFRGDYIVNNRNFNVPSVQFRSYNKMFTGNDQELGNYGINLNYEFYNTDYVIKSDSYNTLKTPETLYPYKKININDLNWNKSGAIAGDNPYMSDKIFHNKDNLSFGKRYVCTWLYKNENGESIWLDRYYNPEKNSFATALESVFDISYADQISELMYKVLDYTQYYDVPDIYNSIDEEYNHTPQTVKDALYGMPIFDKVSDLTLIPNKEYIYYRVGNNFISSIINSLSTNLIEDGIVLRNVNGGIKNVDSLIYEFDGSTYGYFDNYNLINKSNDHSFTILLTLKSDDWSKKFGYQIFGNLIDKGIALISDPIVTPFILVQNGSKMYVYNTDFALLDSSESKSNSINVNIIKDVYRTDHLNFYSSITNPYIIS